MKSYPLFPQHIILISFSYFLKKEKIINMMVKKLKKLRIQ